MAQAIYVLHMPPDGLGLDKCGDGSQVGSKAIRRFLQTHQPKLSLYGHIHESPKVSGKWYAVLAGPSAFNLDNWTRSPTSCLIYRPCSLTDLPLPKHQRGLQTD
jgi:hypothetical protein